MMEAVFENDQLMKHQQEIIEEVIGVNSEIRRCSKNVDDLKGKLKEEKEELSEFSERLSQLVNMLENIEQGQLPLPFEK